jgi:hypothetical protein
MLAGIRVAGTDAAQPGRALFGLDAGQADRLIGGEARSSGDRMALDDGVAGVFSSAG